MEMEKRPWGYYKVLDGEDHSGYKVKIISVEPNHKLSLQSHLKRKEYWIVIKGKGKAVNNNKEIEIQKGDVIVIERQSIHRLINDSQDILEIIEVQLGEYLGEDDIVRYSDDYGRS